jgi:hypothetical protein
LPQGQQTMWSKNGCQHHHIRACEIPFDELMRVPWR